MVVHQTYIYVQDDENNYHDSLQAYAPNRKLAIPP